MSTHVPDNCECMLCQRVGNRHLTLIKGGGEKIPTLREPLRGNVEVTWLAMCRLRGQLDGIKASWTADTQPIEKVWHLVWSKQLDTAMNDYLNENPGLKAGER